MNSSVIHLFLDKVHIYIKYALQLFIFFWFELASIFFFFNLFILAALGLRCCAQAFSSCAEWGLLFIVVHGLLTAVASLVVEHGL